MTRSRNGDGFSYPIDRRRFLGYSAGAGLAAAGLAHGAHAAGTQFAHFGVDAATWTPDYVTSIAGTIEVDTAAECAKVVPLNYKGRLTYWYVGPNEASPQIDRDIDAQLWAAFAKTYPNITVEKTSLGYNQVLDKLRTSAMGNAAPMVARLMLLWAPELAAKGMLMEMKPEDVGIPAAISGRRR